MEPLTPELAVRLNTYLQSHPERSVLYRKDTREWIFTDDDPDGEITAIPDSELGRYFSEFSGRAQISGRRGWPGVKSPGSG